MQNRTLTAVVFLAFFLGTRAIAWSNSDPRITREELEQHVRFLASDELRGRKTGSPESLRASGYLGRQFKEMGLEPAGDNGTFFQSVPMEQIEYTAKPELHFLGIDGSKHVAEWGVAFDLAGGDLRTTGTLLLATVSDDSEMPKQASPMRAYFVKGEREQVKEWIGQLREPGRAGLIMEKGRKELGKAKSRNPRSPRNPRVREARGAPHVRLRGDWVNRVTSGEFVSARFVQEIDSKLILERNVVGKIAGVGTPESPDLAKETVVYSAHFDHIGVSERPPRAVEGEESDLIRNGADDDASGVAAVLELAGAYKDARPPARTLIFLLVTGEEIGLVGTEYYLDHPVVPLEDTVCNLNFEMIGRPDELVGGAGRLWLSGYEYSTLADSIEKSGVAIAADARPDQHFFKRSDNYAFVKRGIVAQTLSTYNLHLDYHRPSDEADTLDFAHMEGCVRSAFRGFKLIVDGSIAPAWRPGIDPKEL